MDNASIGGTGSAERGDVSNRRAGSAGSREGKAGTHWHHVSSDELRQRGSKICVDVCIPQPEARPNRGSRGCLTHYRVATVHGFSRAR